MKITEYIKQTSVLAGVAILLGSCSGFLSTLPDDRQEVNDLKSINQLMESAYPELGMHNLASELSSDNVQQAPEVITNHVIFDQIFAWQQATERNNNSPELTYQGYYQAINAANVALEALAKLPDTPERNARRGEALVARAYGHFVLSNFFSMAYSPETAKTDLGMPYVTVPEKSISFRMERETLEANYKHIETDLEEGIPLLDDSYLTTSTKFRFNRPAAYAFAARFYLYYQKWDKALDYANRVLGTNPPLRNYDAIAAISSDVDGLNIRAIKRQEVTANNNLFFVSFRGTQIGVYFSSAYPYGMRHNHHLFVNGREVLTKAAWWAPGQTTNEIKIEPLEADVQKVTLPVFNHQMAPLGAGTVASTTYAEFTTDETLLVRAEANINLGNYDAALKDMNRWLDNYTTSYVPLTGQTITDWNNATAYSVPTQATPRKQMTPTFTLRDTKHEHFLQVLLHIRRIETLHTGLRWYDVKRYGIEVARVNISINGAITPLDNVLKARDPRHAIQLPESVIAAGLTANPR